MTGGPGAAMLRAVCSLTQRVPATWRNDGRDSGAAKLESRAPLVTAATDVPGPVSASVRTSTDDEPPDPAAPDPAAPIEGSVRQVQSSSAQAMRLVGRSAPSEEGARARYTDEGAASCRRPAVDATGQHRRRDSAGAQSRRPATRGKTPRPLVASCRCPGKRLTLHAPLPRIAGLSRSGPLHAGTGNSET